MNKQDNHSYEEILELTKQGTEIWRRVVVDGIVFDYEVSNLGRIKSLNWNGRGKEIGYGNLDKQDGYMRKYLLYTDENGNKKYKRYYIHRLVASAFILNPKNKPLVDHKDTNRTNNRVDNLSWVTPKENLSNNKTKKNMIEVQKGKAREKLTDEEKYPYVTEEDILVEEWKDIIGYEGIYKISNMGRIKGLGFKRNKFSRNKEGLLQPYINNHGYQTITLTDRSGKSKTHSIHQLVGKHFIDNPNNYDIIDHINTNSADNRYFNLRWVTQQENMNNDKTIEKFTKPVIVLDKNGNVISNGLGVAETAKNIGVSDSLLINLLKSHKPYRANANIKTGNPDLLRSLNGVRAYYISKYNKEEVMREIAEDKTDYSYCVGDLICIYTDYRISEPMSGTNLAKELGISENLIYKMRDNKKPYKAPIRNRGLSKEKFEHLKTLEGIRIIYYEDYLKEHKND